MKDLLVSQKGMSDWGLLWQSTDGTGLNPVFLERGASLEATAS